MIEQKKLNIAVIKHRSLKAVKWSVLAEVVSYLIQPIVVLILARLLSPSDFGVVGIATIAVGLAQIFQDFGLGKTLIQREGRIEESANVIFWLNITLGTILYLLIFMASPLISRFFHEPKTIDVLRVLCLQVVIASFFTIHSALLQRSLQFKQILFARLGASFVPGVVSIPMALMGMGVWALVCGSLAGSLAQLILFWNLNSWRPKRSFNTALAKELIGFSSWVTLELFLGWLIMWGDSIVLGYFLGVKKLGVYRVGVIFLSLPFGIFFGSILPIVYSSFSRLQSNLSELKSSFLKMTRLVAAISLPIGFGLAVLAKPIASVIFTQKWQGIEIVISILAISKAISWLVDCSHGVYRAMGRPDVTPKLHLAVVIFLLPVYILAAPHGLFVFCLASFGVTMLSMLFHFFAANRVLHLPFTYLWNLIKVPIIGAVFMGVIVFSVTSVVNAYNWFGLILSIIMGGIFYLSSLWIMKKDFVIWGFRQVTKMVK